jgi:hypothetical protein
MSARELDPGNVDALAGVGAVDTVAGCLFMTAGPASALVAVETRNDSHTLASAPGLPPISARDLIQPSVDCGLAQIFHGGGGEAVHFVCGFLAGEGLYNPLIATGPRMLKLDARKGASRDWVESSVQFRQRTDERTACFIRPDVAALRAAIG